MEGVCLDLLPSNGAILCFPLLCVLILGLKRQFDEYMQCFPQDK